MSEIRFPNAPLKPSIAELVELIHHHDEYVAAEKEAGREPLRIVDYITVLPLENDERFTKLWNELKAENRGIYFIPPLQHHDPFEEQFRNLRDHEVLVVTSGTKEAQVVKANEDGMFSITLPIGAIASVTCHYQTTKEKKKEPPKNKKWFHKFDKRRW